MRRRDFIQGILGSAAWTLAARAQQGERMRRIGVLANAVEGDPTVQARISAFVQQLQQSGWIEGRNVRFDYRWGRRDLAQTQVGAGELVRLEPDVVFAMSTVAIRALQKETSTIPIVFGGATDPLASGVVKSLAHPGGNVTGFTNFEVSVGRKWLELLKQIAPHVNVVLVIMQPGNEGNLGLWRAIETAAPTFSVRLTKVDADSGASVEREIVSLARAADGGLIVLPNPAAPIRDLILTQAAQYGLPAIYPQRSYVIDGGLLCYAYDERQLSRNAAEYVDRILKGEKPGDLPVQQPTKFDLVINLKTAKALGLSARPTLVAIADEVIE
jgi:putative ABC transport system substrate-binding protein